MYLALYLEVSDSLVANGFELVLKNTSLKIKYWCSLRDGSP